MQEVVQNELPITPTYTWVINLQGTIKLQQTQHTQSWALNTESMITMMMQTLADTQLTLRRAHSCQE